MAVTVIELVNFMVVLILSTAFHEMSHAWTADKFGDPTPRENGRMTWNPFAHLDPFMSLILPGFLYASGMGLLAAAWTPVNPFRMRKPKVHGILCALAGPTTNLLIMLILAVILGLEMGLSGKEGTSSRNLILLGFQLNAFLAVFNFLPIPPLDGGSILQALTPKRYLPAFYKMRQYATWVFLALMLSGVLGKFVYPPMRYLVEVGMELSVAIAKGIGG